jgi:hypothetical protein
MKQLCDAFEFLAFATVRFSVTLPPCHTELLTITNSGIILDFLRLVIAQVCQADRGACAFGYNDAPYSDELIERFLVRFEVLKLGRCWD